MASALEGLPRRFSKLELVEALIADGVKDLDAGIRALVRANLIRPVGIADTYERCETPAEAIAATDWNHMAGQLPALPRSFNWSQFVAWLASRSPIDPTLAWSELRRRNVVWQEGLLYLRHPTPDERLEEERVRARHAEATLARIHERIRIWGGESEAARQQPEPLPERDAPQPFVRRKRSISLDGL